MLIGMLDFIFYLFLFKKKKELSEDPSKEKVMDKLKKTD
jgi:hypothetical protein